MTGSLPYQRLPPVRSPRLPPPRPNCAAPRARTDWSRDEHRPGAAPAAAGLTWEPAAGDRFVVPGRGIDDEAFVLSDMTVEVHDLPTGRIIGFNGTTEWALDSLELDEVVWLPGRRSSASAGRCASCASEPSRAGSWSWSPTQDGARAAARRPRRRERLRPSPSRRPRVVAAGTRDRLTPRTGHAASRDPARILRILLGRAGYALRRPPDSRTCAGIPARDGGATHHDDSAPHRSAGCPARAASRVERH